MNRNLGRAPEEGASSATSDNQAKVKWINRILYPFVTPEANGYRMLITVGLIAHLVAVRFGPLDSSIWMLLVGLPSFFRRLPSPKDAQQSGIRASLHRLARSVRTTEMWPWAAACSATVGIFLLAAEGGAYYGWSQHVDACAVLAAVSLALLTICRFVAMWTSPGPQNRT